MLDHQALKKPELNCTILSACLIDVFIVFAVIVLDNDTITVKIVLE